MRGLCNTLESGQIPSTVFASLSLYIFLLYVLAYTTIYILVTYWCICPIWISRLHCDVCTEARPPSNARVKCAWLARPSLDLNSERANQSGGLKLLPPRCMLCVLFGYTQLRVMCTIGLSRTVVVALDFLLLSRPLYYRSSLKLFFSLVARLAIFGRF